MNYCFLLPHKIKLFDKSYGVNYTPIREFVTFSGIYLNLNLLRIFLKHIFSISAKKILTSEKSYGAKRTTIGYFVNFVCIFKVTTTVLHVYINVLKFQSYFLIISGKMI